MTPEESRKLLISTCATLGAVRVEVTFDGSGDSGSVDGVYLYDAQDQIVEVSNELVLPFMRQFQRWNRSTARYEVVTEEDEAPLEELLKTFCYDVLDVHCPGDWVNNEGGFGTLHIQLTPPAGFRLEYHQRVETTEDHNIALWEEE